MTVSLPFPSSFRVYHGASAAPFTSRLEHMVLALGGCPFARYRDVEASVIGAKDGVSVRNSGVRTRT